MNDLILSDRRKYLGGTDSAAIAGVSPFATAMDVYASKVGLATQTEPSGRMLMGLALEPLVIKLFEQKSGVKVTDTQLRIVHPKHDFIGGTIDGIASDGAIIEAKTTGSNRGWGAPGTSDIPLNYYVQCQHYMHLAKREMCHVPVLFTFSGELMIYEVPADLEVQNSIIERDVYFWENNVLKNIAPELDGSKSCAEYLAKRYNQIHDVMVKADDRMVMAMQELFAVREEIDRLEERKMTVENVIKNAIADNAGIESDLGKITWKAQVVKGKLDSDKLKAKYPEVYNDETIRGESRTTRVLRISQTK